jgi:hypothetical protein
MSALPPSIPTAAARRTWWRYFAFGPVDDVGGSRIVEEPWVKGDLCDAEVDTSHRSG